VVHLCRGGGDLPSYSGRSLVRMSSATAWLLLKLAMGMGEAILILDERVS